MTTVQSTAPTPETYRRFAILSAPLLIGLFIPGLPILAFAVVPPMAFVLGPKIWPDLSRGWAVLYGLGVCVLTYLPVGTMPNLVIPLCGGDWVGTMVPAVLATLAYAVIGRWAVASGRRRFWFLAAVAVPPVHWISTSLLIATGLASDFVC
jgi:hypothetical protein